MAPESRPESPASAPGSGGTRGSIARNAASLLAARGAGAAVAFVFGIYVARTLGVEEFGRFSILMAVYTLLSIFVHLGMESLLVREIARAREASGRHFRAALAVKTASAAICLGLLAAAGLIVPAARPLALPLVLVGLILVLDAASDAMASVFQAHERFGEPSILGLTGGILFALAGSAALFTGGRTTSLLAALAGAKAVQAAAAWTLLHRRLGGALRDPVPVTTRFALGLLAASLPFFLSKLFALLYLRVDMLMLGAMTGEAPVGLYAAAYKFVNVATAAAGAFAAALFPVMASAAGRDPERFGALFSGGVRIMAVGGTLVAAVVWAGAAELLALLFGADYAAAAPAARLLAWTIPALSMNLVLSNALLSLDRERFAVGIGAAALAVNVALNLAWIPGYRESGAAAATLVSEIVVLVAYAACLARAGRLPLSTGSAARFGLCAAALLLPMILLGSLPLAAALGAGAASYLAALLLARFVTGEDLRRLGGLLAPAGRAR